MNDTRTSSTRTRSVASKRLLFWALPAMALAAFLLMALRPRPEPVDVATVTRGSLVVTLDQEGKTRVHDVFTVSAPFAGTLLRTPLHVGDVIDAGKTVIAQIEPADPDLLNPRARAEAEAQVRAAEAAARLARADRERAAAEKEFARAAVQRVRELHAKGAVSKQAIDDAERTDRAAAAAFDVAEAMIKMRDHELARARAALIIPSGDDDHPGCACAELHAPMSGQVLAIAEKSETVVQAGTPLLDIGDPAQMEIVADYLSNEAVTMRPGQRAIVENWGGTPLNAVVDRVEPAAFTKVSALGIEEQRANVILTLTDPRVAWPTLGHGYRVDVRVVAWESDVATIVPLTALFRRDGDWALFVADEGTARLRAVKIGHRAGLQVEVIDGVKAGERVIANPSPRISDGISIRPRSNA